MVSIAPNEFCITGEILSKSKDNTPENFVTVLIRLEKVEHLHGPEGFLEASEKEVEVSMNEALSDDLKKGMIIRCNIRKAPGRFFVIPGSITTGKNES